jgi:hypothetical protein
MRWTGYVVRVRRRHITIFFGGKANKKKLRSLRIMLENYIKMDLVETK